ncbi:hypothetical protein PR048_012002 [Dryococelus australis]|uniref:Uncharacterized protein n=1 Tax=Dryococelus australis TaxID=614101 RepID=A0ABQ9HNH3_9NEOP|nr:hypothetical protein PR048_012002 [Dryococelus australis]
MLAQFLNFLEGLRCMIESFAGGQKYKNSYKRTRLHVTQSLVASAGEESTQCDLCQEYHTLSELHSFLIFHRDNRLKSLCINCFRTSHILKNCPSNTNCHQCNLTSHTLLHFDKDIPSETEELSGHSNRDSTERRSSDLTPAPTLTGLADTSFVLLATALVGVQDKTGKSVTVRVLLELGSQANFITRNYLQKLWLPRQKYLRPVYGLPGSPVTDIKVITICYVHLVDDSAHQFGADMADLNQISVAMNSLFCWLIMGRVDSKTVEPSSQLVMCLHATSSIDKTIKRVWES